jgi:hypothetical protein
MKEGRENFMRIFRGPFSPDGKFQIQTTRNVVPDGSSRQKFQKRTLHPLYMFFSAIPRPPWYKVLRSRASEWPFAAAVGTLKSLIQSNGNSPSGVY